ncbi:MAG: methyl-accepting chemotaxis protein [Candidatus Latescibacterota bacterium]|nr:MAG: methyl-accepting chemotaxis protein [Candidatus Latescibacterota bacterium]
MSSNRPPVLTSPWKMGFFVSLMLVFVGIGVTYFFMDKTGVTWNWQDKNEWLAVLDGEGFLAEIYPLIALVALSSLISSLAISSGVRKYRRYLESGLDYKNLLISLKDINDIRDTSKIEKMRHQPELKRVLLNVSQYVNDQAKALDQRETEVTQQAAEELRAREDELNGEFNEQCEELTRAIENPVGGRLDDEIEISHPALKRVEYAVRSAMRTTAPEEGAFEFSGADEDTDSSYNDLKKASDVLYNRLEEIVGEMKQSVMTAKDIEKQLLELPSPSEPAASEETKGLAGALETVKSIDKLSESLGALSEEAKGIAISTALSAGSGEGTQDDLIRLAEEVKEISSRFKSSSTQFAERTAELKTTIDELDASRGVDAGRFDAAEVGQSIAALQSKVALWVERIVVLSDKVATFQDSYNLSVSSLPEAEEGARDHAATAPVADVSGESEQDEEFGFESLDGAKPLFSKPEEEPAEPEQIPGFETLTRPDTQAQVEWEEDQMVEDRVDGAGEADLATPAADLKTETPPDEPKPETLAETLEMESPPDEFETDTQTADIGQEEPVGDTDVEAPAEAPEEGVPAVRRDSDDDTDVDDDKVVDLYALGAVDYDPAVHG